MNGFSVFLCMVAAIIASVSATDYCSSTICKAGVSHIACGHSGKFATSCPADAQMITMTDSLKKILVDGHNEKRNLIAGGGHAKHSSAIRMATMQWDDELAANAALNVMQCDMKHDKCRNTDAFKSSGQNLAWRTYSGTPDAASLLAKGVENWYNEVGNSQMEYINAFPTDYKGPTIGHFTVMVADRNIRLGCAASTYSIPGKSSKACLLACNYATTNMQKFPIYTSGKKAGSACTTGTNPAYPNLCSTSEVYAVNKWF